ncbi:MAG: TonB-dependent receptor [Aestuariibacter sp.]
MKQTNFSKKRLSATISMLLGATTIAPVMAQEAESSAAENQVEIIQVSGIRGSMARSMDIKRESSGIVDAISAEEMGKFPDTNLAESLQRITGVTISRSNNEGSEITVRGFGPDKNLLTLNGRQMPGTGNNRSFKLENLSSAGVSALEVYKSSRVDVPSGGLGATVDIITAKPLASPGLKYTFSSKGIYDESNELGDDVTPEIAGLYSQTFADNTFGVSLSASYQERDFQQQSANIPGWQANTGPFGSATNNVDPRPEVEEGSDQDLIDGVSDGRAGNTFLPRQISYDINDVQRSRTNAHLTLQWAPRDDMTFTADYMYAEAETATEGYGFGIWFNFGGNVSNYELDENGTATRFTEIQNDFAHSRTAGTTLVEQDSIGFNWEWQLTDNFHLELDYHDSQVDFDDGADKGTNARSLLILGPNNIATKTYDFTSGGIPNFAMTWPGGADEASANDFDPLFAQFQRGIGTSAVEQIQLDTKWDNPIGVDWLIDLRAGAAYTEQSFYGRTGFSGNQGPNGYNGNMAIFPDSMFVRTETSELLDEFAGGGSELTTNYYFDWNLNEALSRLQAFFPNFTTDPFNPGGQTAQGTIQEDTTAAYIAAKMEFEINDRILDVNVGLRYEETEVYSTTLQRAEDFVVWSNPTEWQMRYVEGADVFVDGSGEYDLLLPSLDLRYEVYDDMYLRFSAGKTLARSPLGFLGAGRGLAANPKPGGRNGSAGNPGLEPFESTNFDISYEWYYDEASYVSIAYFKKDVVNFVGPGTNLLTFEGLHDPFIGPRANTAISQLESEGIQPTVTAIWERIIDNGGGINDDCCQTQIVRGNPDDPLIEWLVSQPVNSQEEKGTDGIEFAFQHMFDDTGFGVSMNFTLVDSDSEFDINDLSVQEPLTDISDSANFQVFYEDDQWSVKITHTWRDDYLIGVGQPQGSADSPPQFFADTNITDFSVNYNVTEELTLFAEGYNITNETERGYGRYDNQFLFGRQYGPRYAFGLRYTFE